MGAHNFVDYFFRRINGATRVSFDANLDRLSGEGTYLFANGLPIGMATPGDCQGIKMEFDYGVTPTLTTGKMAHGLDIKMTMDQDWSIATKPYNATVRGARIQAWSEDNVSGRLTGAYISARAEGTSKEIEGYISGETGPGIIGIQARTELGTSATITSPAAVGLMVYHYSKASSTLTGGYRGIQVEVPLMGSAASISSTTYGIYVGNDWGGGDTFDYGLYIATGTCVNGIGIVVAAATASDKYGIYVNNSYTKTDGGVHKGISSIVTYTPATSGYSAVIGVAAKVTLNSDMKGGTGYLWPMQAQLDFGSSADFDAGTGGSGMAAALRAVITKSGSPTFASGNIAGIYIDNLASGLEGCDHSALLWMSNNATSTLGTAIKLYGSRVTNFVDFVTCAVGEQMIAEDGGGVYTHAGTGVKIRIKVDDTTYYLLGSTGPTS